jgi:molybdenum cofactor biosynthesis enzyme MoaA
LEARPSLRYVEYHLVEHCNLDCTGCGHFSPFAQEQFADPRSFEKDPAQLARLFGNIGKIRLMGGEPLLHPEPGAFLQEEGILTNTRHRASAVRASRWTG